MYSKCKNSKSMIFIRWDAVCTLRNFFIRRDAVCTLVFLLFFCIGLNANIKSLWVTPWDITSEEKVLQVIEDAKDWGITDLLVEVRYRGDTFYVPNRIYNDFPNFEPVSYLLSENPYFDALQTFIDNLKGSNIRLHAWVTVNVITTRRIETIQEDHLYFTRPEWLTHNANGNRIRFEQFEGAFLDPGVPEVKEYLVNIFSDIVQNYDIDGLHLDYIRYPATAYGHNPISVERFHNQSSIDSFSRWKEIQIMDLIEMIGKSVKEMKPNLIYSAAVFSNLNVAINNYSQNWLEWLDIELVDYVYIMAYQTRNRDFEQIVTNIPMRYRNKVVVGLRAWSDDGTYSSQSLRDKVVLTPEGYAGICFFSYGGIIQRSYQSVIRR